MARRVCEAAGRAVGSGIDNGGVREFSFGFKYILWTNPASEVAGQDRINKLPK